MKKIIINKNLQDAYEKVLGKKIEIKLIDLNKFEKDVFKDMVDRAKNRSSRTRLKI